MPKQVIMPQLGESIVEGTVTRWLKKEGESIQEFEPLLEVNTDKVDSEIPAPASGTVLQILIPEGETVRAGTVLAWIGQPEEQIEGAGDGGGKATRGEEKEKTAGSAPEESRAEAPAAGRDRDLGFISPIVAKLAQENQVDLSQVTGSGQGGRITKKDVLAFIEQKKQVKDVTRQKTGGVKEAAPDREAPAWETPADGDLFRPTEMVFGQTRAAAAPKPATPQPVKPATPAETAAKPEGAHAEVIEVPAPQTGDRLVPLSIIRRKIAEHMMQSVRTSPHVTTVMEADLTRMLAHYQANRSLLERDGVHLTYSAYFAAATAQALRQVPMANSSWTDDGILIHAQINLGIAVSLGEDGLIVPVIKNADGLSLVGLARAIKDLADRARSRSLKPDETRDGTMTITNHGISGSLFANPIINQPQCGILGVGAVQKRVVVTPEDAIAVRPMVYLSFTFDHRILDGASADGFLSKVVAALENWK